MAPTWALGMGMLPPGVQSPIYGDLELDPKIFQRRKRKIILIFVALVRIGLFLSGT